MIYYFSGTRNSRYAAIRIGSLTGNEVRFIPALDPYNERIDLSADESAGKSKYTSIGFVFPVYAWGVPPVVMDFIERLPEKFVQYVNEHQIAVWCVATCGDETGMAVEMLRKGLAKRGIKLAGAWSLIMPNVYVLLPGFGTDPKDVEERKLSEAVRRIEEIASRINDGIWEDDVHLGPWPRVKTSIVYPLFKRWGVNTKKWHYTDACIGCGKCERGCPVGNIAITNGRPIWGTDCTSCCACYHVCPTRGAQYGSVTKNAGQYYFKDKRLIIKD
ncbi:MAG: EFR1 family ferrodoxin [Muribaculaceae bacterium]|nr:EFR1 family ferrodoxin [Muribaculaceae bacterium]